MTRPFKQPKHTTTKLFRKIRLSASIDKDANRLLDQIAEKEKRSPSNALNLIIYEARVGQERSYAARCQHDLRLQDGGWRISLKKVVLVNGDSPLYNLTFLI